MTKQANLLVTNVHLLLFALILGRECVYSQDPDYQTRDCHSQSGRHYHGEVYRRDKTGACMQFRCDNGNEILTETKCRDETGHCYRIGEVRHHSQCIQQTCVMSGEFLTLRATRRECDFKGQCAKVNQVLTDGCLTYRCSETLLAGGNYQLSLELDKAACRDAETDLCHELGSTWQTKRCATMRCEPVQSDLNGYATRTVVVGQGCPDDNGRCHKPDGINTFVVTVQGRVRQCTCQYQVNSSSVQYSCLSTGSTIH